MNEDVLKQIENRVKKQTEANADERDEVRNYLIARFGDKFAEWEKEYAPRKLNYIDVEDKMALLRPIDPETLSSYSMLLVASESGGLVVATRFVLEELWLGGDDEIRDNDDYFMAAMIQVQQVMEQKKSRFIKL